MPRFSQKVFEQAAGIPSHLQRPHPLDNTEYIPSAITSSRLWRNGLGKTVADLTGSGVRWSGRTRPSRPRSGNLLLSDIVEELSKPGRDPRSEFHAFDYREDIHGIRSLNPGMVCPGIVTNVTNFGAFVDIGVHQDGLVHISQLSDRFIKDPRDVVNPGDHVQVRVLEVNLDKQQIALTMKSTTAGVRSKPAEPQAKQIQDNRQSEAPKPKAFNNPFADQLANWKKSK